MARRKIYHVTPRTDGSWDVKKEKALKTSTNHDTRAETIACSNQWAIGCQSDRVEFDPAKAGYAEDGLQGCNSPVRTVAKI